MLLLAVPVIFEFLPKSSEKYSEIYLLGPNQMVQDIPFNVVSGQEYSVYVGVANHLDNVGYYVFYLKLRNQTNSQPDKTTSTPSAVAPFCEFRTIVENNKNLTTPLKFSLSSVSASDDKSLLQSITINDEQYTVNKIAQYDQENNGYYYQILIELWAYYPESNVLQYQNRNVYFWLNATST